MKLRSCLASLIAVGALSGTLGAQTVADHVNLYLSDWHDAKAQRMDRNLEVRTVYSRGDSQNPAKKGEVLHELLSYNYDTLSAGESTGSIKVSAQEQKILFVTAGAGTLTSAGKSYNLKRNVGVLVPANGEFALKSTGPGKLEMYEATEPVPAGFRPNDAVLVRDANTIPFSPAVSHWNHIDKALFTAKDGLATMEAAALVQMDTLTMGVPHRTTPHGDIEEIWSALSGTSLAFVSNQLFRQPPGVSFYHIPDDNYLHTNMVYSETEPAEFFYVARYADHAVRP